MSTIPLPRVFKEFLKLLNSHGVEYVLIGGYAVNCHGYLRTTGDLDVLVAINPRNVDRLAEAVREFGFNEASPHLFLNRGAMMRMGNKPNRIEILTEISAVTFGECHRTHIDFNDGDMTIPVIDLELLMRNKAASARHKDLENVNN